MKRTQYGKVNNGVKGAKKAVMDYEIIDEAGNLSLLK